MKRNFVCIFAHPDDEAFGPSGTIHKLTKEYNVYLICATKGQAGQDSDKQEIALAKRRVQELKESAKLLGVKKVYVLPFRDGYLCNAIYHKVAEKIQRILEELKPEKIMTFPPTGISGHLDHIAISMITSYVFYRLPNIQEMWQTAITEAQAQNRKDYFVYFPPGYKKSDIDKTVDVSDVWELKVKAMMTHQSQKHDADNLLKLYKNFPKEEYFLVRKKAS